MRPRLLFEDRDAAIDRLPHGAHADLRADLGLEAVVAAMAAGDATLAGVARRTLLEPLVDPAAIAYRHEVLDACRSRPELVRTIYDIVAGTLESRKKVYWGLVTRPDAVVHHSLEILALYRAAFRRLRRVADAEAALPPRGLGGFLARVRETLDDAFLESLAEHLDALRFTAGARVGARLGSGNAGTGYRLERPPRKRGPSLGRLWASPLRATDAVTVRLPPGDDSGPRALAELLARGLGRSATVLAGACDDLLWHFRQIRGELGFYLGCLELERRLDRLGLPLCLPRTDGTGLDAQGLYDAGLALAAEGGTVGNDVAAADADLIVVTGANGGGKTTFLRSVGLAQLLMQAGMKVPARSFRSPPAPVVATHFSRREDPTLRSGKLDDELARLDAIVARLRPGSLVLLNESLSSTNEREGSEIADGVVRALTEAGIRVVFVTHLGVFARGLLDAQRPRTHFLRAERRADGTRTFRMVEAAPERGSHGTELYRRTLGAGAVTREGASGAPDPGPGG